MKGTRTWTVEFRYRDPDYIDNREREDSYNVVAPNVKCAIQKAITLHGRGHSRGVHELIGVTLMVEAEA